MSLDNGIQVMRIPEVEQIPELAAFDNEWSKKYNFDILICNWKNCWAIRNAIFDIINSSIRFDDKNRMRLDVNDIEKIITFLEALSKSIWEDFGGSIRAFEEMEVLLRRDVESLRTLKELMGKHNLVVYFYELF